MDLVPPFTKSLRFRLHIFPCPSISGNRIKQLEYSIYGPWASKTTDTLTMLNKRQKVIHLLQFTPHENRIIKRNFGMIYKKFLEFVLYNSFEDMKKKDIFKILHNIKFWIISMNFDLIWTFLVNFWQSIQCIAMRI